MSALRSKLEALAKRWESFVDAAETDDARECGWSDAHTACSHELRAILAEPEPPSTAAVPLRSADLIVVMTERDAAVARAEKAEAECDALRRDWMLEQGLRSEVDRAREVAELECERLRKDAEQFAGNIREHAAEYKQLSELRGLSQRARETFELVVGDLLRELALRDAAIVERKAE